MKKLLLILSLLINVAFSQSLHVVKEAGLMEHWGDSPGVAFYDSKIQVVGQAEYAVLTSKKHYVFDTSGNLLYKFDAPFIARAESLMPVLNGKMYCVGGTTAQDVWEFNGVYSSTGWKVTDPDYTSKIGNHAFGFGGVIGTWFYYGGGVNSNTFWKTQDFKTWTSIGNLPTDINNLAACASTIHKGELYVIGGVSTDGTALGVYTPKVNGYVYKYNPVTGWIKVTQSKENFGQIWCDAVSDGTNIYLVKGYVSTQQAILTGFKEGNQRGVMSSSDGITWTNLGLYDGTATFSERHRTGVVNAAGIACLLAGNYANDFWIIK